jgi:hypothetical protein
MRDFTRFKAIDVRSEGAAPSLPLSGRVGPVQDGEQRHPEKLTLTRQSGARIAA